MRNILTLFFKTSLFIGVLLPVNVYAEEPVVISSVSAGVFRFQLKLAEHGNAEAQYKVGEMYELGTGVPQDEKIAISWFEKAAAQGHKKSDYKLLYLDVKSNGLNDKTKTRLGTLRQQAASGNANAQYFLGKMYTNGVGVPKSLDNALIWLNKATFNGVPEAEHEAIAVSEKLAQIKEKDINKRNTALEAAKKQKAEQERLKAKKLKDAERKRRAEAAKRKSNKNAEARRAAEKKAAERRVADQRKLMEAERRALAEEKAKLEKERQAVEAEKARKAEQDKKAKSAKSNHKNSFESDPCKGKSARFLSTCR